LFENEFEKIKPEREKMMKFTENIEKLGMEGCMTWMSENIIPEE